MRDVRKATPADLSALTGALSRAFDDDPVMEWLFPDPRKRPRWTRAFFGVRVRQLLRQEEVWTTGDCAGAAVWAQPERWELSLGETLDMMARIGRGVGRRTVRGLRGLSLIEKHHPHEPHWYLAVLGVDPPAQGQGLGSALLEPVLRACDGDGVAAYLESSKERNVAFYARHGFRVTEEVRMPKGPPLWLMWRDPR
jgi:ribosomal protein S18 acetylase RimI-like enzyme